MRRGIAGVVTAVLVSLLAACGGGGGGGGGSAAAPGGGSAAVSGAGSDVSPGAAGASDGAAGASGGSASSEAASSSSSSVTGAPVNAQQAARFLIQASFGPTPASIDALTGSSVEAWIEQQFATPQVTRVEEVTSIPYANRTLNLFWEMFWKNAIAGQDQLRQRMAFALSEVFVISLDGDLSYSIRGVTSYYDMLGRDAFGNFRTLLEDVARHPAMGAYLTYLHNQKEDGHGRMPDENFARELMQLATIGLYQLNLDGTPRLVNGKPVETYTNDDVTGLAKVFTGFSYAGPDQSSGRFFGTGALDPNRDILPMQGYPQYHSTSTKTFLGTTIAAQSPANPDASLKIALDTIFNHPNVGPFIGKQLIQRLVTSNPSPAYVARVAAAFNDNGKGVRGDMKAVIRAILLDEQARSASIALQPTYGKLREPVIRLANWARAFGASAVSGRFAIGDTSSASVFLAQAPLKAPSVFNFFRPGYVPPNSQTAAMGMVSPEMQITHETSIAAYLNFMQGVVQNGLASSTGQEINRIIPTYAPEIALADTPGALVDRINLLLFANVMRTATRSRIVDAISTISIPTSSATAANNARKNRVYLAIFLAMAAPDYIVQK